MLWELRFTPVGNFISETVVKTLEHGLHGSQRRTQEYARMLVAARHRPQRWPMNDADYALASKQIGTSKESRVTAKRDLNLTLQSVSLASEAPGLNHAPLWLKEYELQEDDQTSDQADEAAADDDRGGMAGCAQDSKAKVADIRRVLSDDTVIEVLWEYTPEGRPRVYLALIEEIKPRIVRARWLDNVCSDLYIIDPNYKTESIEIKQIWDTCADVAEMAGDRPDEVPAGARWWRRSPSADEEVADKANDETNSLSSLPKYLQDLKANQDAYEARKAKQEEEHRTWRLSHPFQDEMDELARTMDSGVGPNFVLYPGTKEGAGRSTAEGSSAEELPEPELFGSTRRLRDGNMAYPSSSRTQWLSDVILANAHAADARHEGSVPVRCESCRIQTRAVRCSAVAPAVLLNSGYHN